MRGSGKEGVALSTHKAQRPIIQSRACGRALPRGNRLFGICLCVVDTANGRDESAIER